MSDPIAGTPIFFETTGTGAPVMLIAGLSGVGRGSGEQIERFGAEFLTITLDHPGAGSSTAPPDGYTVEGHARAMAEVLRSLGCGSAHIVDPRREERSRW